MGLMVAVHVLFENECLSRVHFIFSTADNNSFT